DLPLAIFFAEHEQFAVFFGYRFAGGQDVGGAAGNGAGEGEIAMGFDLIDAKGDVKPDLAEHKIIG
ncbi:MAG: hypothetical protein KDC43_28415, partial [Saprospiraceae bacterium]|nr:hypothetical protein [Saprospiraceae bacterium]